MDDSITPPPAKFLRTLENLRDRGRRLLAVFPHPDDEAYGCAGAFAREGAREDGVAALFCLTRGEASSMGHSRGLTPEEVGFLRTRRVERVRDIVGLGALRVGGFPDGRLARCKVDDVGAAIGAAIDALRPQVVVGHCPRGVNGHADHIATHWAIRHALLSRPGVRFAMITYSPEVVEQARPRLLFPTPLHEMDAALTLSPAEIDAKEACLRAHDAIVTLRAGGAAELFQRPPIEHYDFLGEDFTPPLADLFERLPPAAGV